MKENKKKEKYYNISSIIKWYRKLFKSIMFRLRKSSISSSSSINGIINSSNRIWRNFKGNLIDNDDDGDDNDGSQWSMANNNNNNNDDDDEVIRNDVIVSLITAIMNIIDIVDMIVIQLFVEWP